MTHVQSYLRYSLVLSVVIITMLLTTWGSDTAIKQCTSRGYSTAYCFNKINR